ncbi:hypothetical protein [Microbacterium sp. KNMS]
MTSDRYCVRGCVVRDEHRDECSTAAAERFPCRGCVPIVARAGAMVCERCYRTLRGYLEDAADMVGLLRSIADPSKSSWNFDRIVTAGRVDLPAPVQSEIIDASNDITVTLRAWAYDLLGVERDGDPRGLEAGADAAAAFEAVVACADIVLAELDAIANDAVAVLKLWADVAQRSEGEPSRWTVADAVARWPLNDRPRTAEQPCPECEQYAVRVIPSRRAGRPTRYLCRECDWSADSTDDGGLWSAVFREEVIREEPVAHDPRWMTLAAAARLVKRTPATVRSWADKLRVRRQDGRYWRDDLEPFIPSEQEPSEPAADVETKAIAQ